MCDYIADRAEGWFANMLIEIKRTLYSRPFFHLLMKPVHTADYEEQLHGISFSFQLS